MRFTLTAVLEGTGATVVHEGRASVTRAEEGWRARYADFAALGLPFLP